MISIKELFSEPDEFHAWLIGISHGFFVWQKNDLSWELGEEQHYYEQGKIAGIFLWLPFGAGWVLVCWLAKVLLF